jgi:predicted lactoylglutathione lyase
MATKIFINLPVKDLQKSIHFFTQLGFTFNPEFTDDKATCMIIGENIFAMLLVEERFKDFTKKQICDAHQSTEMLIAIDAESRHKIDEMVQKAVDAGGSIYAEPKDHGWMYYHSFADLDGHQWELLYMDQSALPTAPTQEQELVAANN